MIQIVGRIDIKYVAASIAIWVQNNIAPLSMLFFSFLFCLPTLDLLVEPLVDLVKL